MVDLGIKVIRSSCKDDGFQTVILCILESALALFPYVFLISQLFLSGFLNSVLQLSFGDSGILSVGKDRDEVTLEMIKDTARFVMERAKIYPNMGSVSTGGFEAEYRDGYMYLRFVPFEYVG